MQKKAMISFQRVSKQYFLQEDRTFKELLPNLLFKGIGRQKQVFSNLSFAINQGETVGIIGRNGAGKSTIMKLIAGVTYPTSGKVNVAGTVAPLIELGAGFHHELSGYENIYLNSAILGLHKSEVDAHVDDIIAFSGLAEYINTPLKRYSSGMQMRLAFAVAIHTEAPILLIDEVLAVGDVEFQEKCLAKLDELKATEEKTIVFVSHDQTSVEKFCERALVLEEGQLVFDGKPKEAFKQYHKLLDRVPEQKLHP